MGVRGGGNRGNGGVYGAAVVLGEMEHVIGIRKR